MKPPCRLSPWASGPPIIYLHQCAAAAAAAVAVALCKLAALAAWARRQVCVRERGWGERCFVELTCIKLTAVCSFEPIVLLWTPDGGGVGLRLCKYFSI